VLFPSVSVSDHLATEAAQVRLAVRSRDTNPGWPECVWP